MHHFRAILCIALDDMTCITSNELLMNFLELVKARYSSRNYDARPVEQEKLDYIMECVRLAPSAVNLQPWRFRIVTDKETIAQIPIVTLEAVERVGFWDLFRTLLGKMSMAG
jgi:hypothetical protein